MSADVDDCMMLFIIATNRVDEAGDGLVANYARDNRPTTGSTSVLKRATVDTTMESQAKLKIRKSMKVAQRVDSQPSSDLHRTSEYQPSMLRRISSSTGDHLDSTALEVDNAIENDQKQDSQPLFLASQLSVADMEATYASGLGIETMNAEEFAAMLDDNDEQVDFTENTTRVVVNKSQERKISEKSLTEDELEHDELEDNDSYMSMGPSQFGGSDSKVRDFVIVLKCIFTENMTRSLSRYSKTEDICMKFPANVRVYSICIYT